MSKYPALETAVAYCRRNEIKLPPDLIGSLEELGIKAATSLSQILSDYHTRIVQAIIDFFTGARLQDAKGRYKRATSTAFIEAFDLGYRESSGGEPEQQDAEWLAARQAEEFGYIDQLFLQMRELRKEEDFDYFSWAGARADGYKNSLKIVYNEGKMRGARNKMLTFVGDDGMESCKDCQKYKGKRHRASWWISHNAIPPNRDFECHGYRCEHYLVDDNGVRFTG